MVISSILSFDTSLAYSALLLSSHLGACRLERRFPRFRSKRTIHRPASGAKQAAPRRNSEGSAYVAASGPYLSKAASFVRFVSLSVPSGTIQPASGS